MLRFIFMIMIFGLFSSCQDKQSQPESEQPENHPFKNIVVIIGDDHATHVLGCYGNEIIRTPNLDRMAAEGVRFTNAYANAPICSASRQSLLTGKYPHSTGVNLLFTPFQDKGNITLAEHLRDQGFATAAIGKMHLNNWVWSHLYKESPPDHGFDLMQDNAEYRAFLEENPPQKIPDDIETYHRDGTGDAANTKNAKMLPSPCFDEDCKGTYLANEAVRFIEAHQNERFLLWVGFNEPHASFNFPIEYRNRYNPEDMPLPEGSPEDDQWVPEQFKGLSDAEKRGIIASYYTSVEYLDKNVGLILNGLSENGLSDSTLIVYLGDHGYLLNDHKRFEKHMMWEEAAKAPLIIQAGNQFGKGKVFDQITGFVDVVPTILEALQVPSISEVEGKSLMPLLTGQSKTHKEIVFSEYLEDNKAMVTDGTWKYIFSAGVRDLSLGYQTGAGPLGISHRLYNLEKDPRETTNVAKLSENSQTLERLQNEMLNKFLATHPEAEMVPETFTLEGKLVWFTYARDIGALPGGTPLRVFPRE